MMKNIFLSIFFRFKAAFKTFIESPAELNFLPMNAWRECAGDIREQGEFETHLVGQPCYAAILRRPGNELITLALLFHQGKGKFKYSVLHYEFDAHDQIGLVNMLQRCLRRFSVRKVAVDRFDNGARNLSGAFFGDDEIVGMGMGFLDLSAATEELRLRVLLREIDHRGDAALAEMARNLTVIYDSGGNAKPDMARSSGKISGIVALIMAIAVMMADE